MKTKSLRHQFNGTSRHDSAIVKGLTDEQLLDLVQRQTLRYFWEFGHAPSGMARERSDEYGHSYNTEHTVTTGGTGFGIMGMVAGAERGLLPKKDVRKRIEKIVGFLEQSEKFHGAFSHFLDGRTGKAVPFSPNDDGGDVVETAYLMMGLLTAREYFNGRDKASVALRDRINNLWEGIEWDWYTRGEDNLYWHWSEKKGWIMNHPVKGWDECLIAHVLAASSPTHPVKPAVYINGWTQNYRYRNGMDFYGHRLPLGPQFGGPLFFSQYTFLGLDPRGLKDRHADYWQQNRNHTLINYKHCVRNPFRHEGYGKNCWGLTASDAFNDGEGGYHAHAPDNDRGTITPTAALSAFPYTPEQSMAALRHFYEDRGHEIWRDLGFADAFNPGKKWVAQTHLAIDQGPIVGMVENHRSGLLWRLFMNAPEVKYGLTKLGFDSPYLNPPAAKRTSPAPTRS